MYFGIENGVLKSYVGDGRNVTIPEGVTRIGDKAFLGCSRLTSVEIPDSVTAIGEEAFAGCCSLERVTFPEEDKSAWKKIIDRFRRRTGAAAPKEAKSIGEGAFRGCRSLAAITIPEGVTGIGAIAFYGCESLAGITIPDSVTSIGMRAFWECRSLAKVTMGKGVERIGEDIFHGCEGLADRDGFVIVNGILCSYCGPGGEVRIPESVTSIGAGAFHRLGSLTDVILPSGVTGIGDRAFWDCGNLRSASIPDSVTSIGESAFFYCKKLTRLRIPKGVTSIGKGAFYTGGRIGEVIAYTPYAVSCAGGNVRFLIYLGGPLSDLDEKYRIPAARGFLHLREQGRTEADPWRESYLEYIRENAAALADDAESGRTFLRRMFREAILDEKAAERLMEHFDEKGDTEAKAALLQCCREYFGTGGPEDLSI